MSDGMNDASAIGRQESAVREAAYNLAIALKRADDGHRGVAISRIDLERIVNEYLKGGGAPFTLRVVY